MTTSNTATVGDLLAAFLEAAGVRHAFGVLSVHNMPLLDALARRDTVRYICARGEAGAVNMADAYARIQGQVGVAFTSTGAGAGNACGALIEASTAGTPLLHITGQVESAYLDKGLADVHEAKDQLAMLEAASKAALRVWSADTALGVFRQALQLAQTAPCGPVSIEIPIDIQGAVLARWPDDLRPLPVPVAEPSGAQLDALADLVRSARRPMLWLGGGARHAGAAARQLLDAGFGAVTTIQGRGVIDENDARSLGSFNLQPSVEAFYQSCDLMLVVGSRLRVPETARHTLKLPDRLVRIDADPTAQGKAYVETLFVHGDAQQVLQGLADRLAASMDTDPAFHADLAAAREQAQGRLRANIGRYAQLNDCLQQLAGADCNWVRDVTISNGTWGNRLFRIPAPYRSAHASGGGIGQCLSMAIGAAMAAPQRRTLALVGDGGLMLNAAELPTAVQEKTGIVLLVMNDRGYGILRNLADAQFGGRRFYSDLHTPRFEALAAAYGYTYFRISSFEGLEQQLRTVLQTDAAATLVEFDMDAIGPFAQPFSGPKI
ncbi:MAG: thiamine pyrophosphate-binding protein [Rhodoferax sp.]|nr:thiamine pyrophosphate-binding protein [Rhodoferax sp.]